MGFRMERYRSSFLGGKRSFVGLIYKSFGELRSGSAGCPFFI